VAAERRKKREKEKEEDCDEEEFEEGERIPDLTPAVGGTVIHSTFHDQLANSDVCRLPIVYSAQHTLCFAAKFLPSLLLSDEELVVLKGLESLEALAQKLNRASLDKTTLEDVVLRRTMAAVTEKVLVKCPSKLIRRRSVEWVKGMAAKFEPSSRFYYIRGLYYSSGHPGFRGYIISHVLKPEIEDELNQEQKARSAGQDRDAESRLFVGPNMKSWFVKLFSLPEGVETDLLQHQDTVMASLNLLRYLLIRDPSTKNLSGVWSVRDSFQKDFLQPLRKGLDLSRAHYQLELKQIASGERYKGPELSVDVGQSGCDERVPQMPSEQEADIMRVALHSFDMMDSVLCRVDQLSSTKDKAA